MDAVDRILSFIDNENETEEQAPEQAPEAPEAPTDARNEVRQAQAPTEEQQPEPQQEPQQQPEAPGHINYDYTRDDKQYKSMLRKLNNNIKKSRYPCVVEIGGDGNANMMFNNETEIKTYLNNLKDERRRVIKEAKQKEINEYVNKNKKSLKRINTKEYIKNDDELLSDSEEEPRKIYKKGPLKAIQHEEDFIEVPRTSKKDRTTLIKNIKKNPEQLKDLVRTKDNNEFDIKTEEILRDNEEMKNLYNIHHNNPFNRDITWTRESFLKAMDDMMYEHEQKKQEMVQRTSGWLSEPQAKQRLRDDTEIRRARQNNNIYNDYVLSSGINPDLMKRY